MRQLGEILQLTHSWSSGWVVAKFRASPSPDGGCPRGVAKCKYPIWMPGNECSPTINLDSAQMIIAGTAHARGEILPRGHNVSFVLTAGDRWFDRNWSDPSKISFGDDNHEFTDLIHIPTRLGEFQHWWASLRDPQILDIPRNFACVAGIDGDPSPVELVRDQAHPYFWLSPDLLPAVAPGTTRVDLYSGHAGDSPQFGLLANLPQGITIFFPFAEIEEVRISQKVLTGYFGNWTEGPFSDAFYDLDQATQDMKEWDLADIQKVLFDESSKGAEVFEAVGIKFPATQVTVAGILVILSIQFYLLIYLRQLSGKLMLGDPGWDVPWIGMNQSRAARIALFVTLVVLPIFTVLLLGGHSLLHRIHAGSFLVPREQIVRFLEGKTGMNALGLLLAVATCTLLSILCWRWRPKIVPIQEEDWVI